MVCEPAELKTRPQEARDCPESQLFFSAPSSGWLTSTVAETICSLPPVPLVSVQKRCILLPAPTTLLLRPMEPKAGAGGSETLSLTRIGLEKWLPPSEDCA